MEKKLVFILSLKKTVKPFNVKVHRASLSSPFCILVLYIQIQEMDDFSFPSQPSSQTRVMDDGCQILTPTQLANYMKGFGIIAGYGKFKGPQTVICVQSPNDKDCAVYFNIGIYQGLKLIKKKTSSASVSDVENLLDADDDETKGVFHLLVQNANVLYTIKSTRENWYEVDLLKLQNTCPECGQPKPYRYEGGLRCIPFY